MAKVAWRKNSLRKPLIFNAQEITKSVIDEVKQKIKSLALPKNMSIRPVLIHVNGVDESVLESDFFSCIIDFNDFLHKH